MKLFITILFSSVIFLVPLTSVLLKCTTVDDKSKGAVFIQMLNSLDPEKITQILERLDQPSIAEIQKILDGEDANAQSDMIKELGYIIAPMFHSTISNLEEFMSNEIIPNHHAACITGSFVFTYGFLCGWLIIVEVLEKVYGTENIGGKITKMDELFEEVDKLNPEPKRLSKRKGKDNRQLTKLEFIALMRENGPKLDEELIQNVTECTIPSYQFNKRYRESVLLSFTGWLDYLTSEFEEEKTPHLKIEIIKELKKLKTNEGWNWENHVQSLALIMSRDQYLGNYIKHKFWLQYQYEIAQNPRKDFEEILDSTFYQKWYYTKNSTVYFNVIVKACRNSKRRTYTELEIYKMDFEPFLIRDKSGTIGLPQSPACSFSNKKWKYFFNRWSTRTSPAAEEVFSR